MLQLRGAARLTHDSACRYCGSPISILDPDAVAKTVNALNTAQTRLNTVDVDRLAAALLTHRRPMRPCAPDERPCRDRTGGVAALLIR